MLDVICSFSFYVHVILFNCIPPWQLAKQSTIGTPLIPMPELRFLKTRKLFAFSESKTKNRRNLRVNLRHPHLCRSTAMGLSKLILLSTVLFSEGHPILPLTISTYREGPMLLLPHNLISLCSLLWAMDAPTPPSLQPKRHPHCGEAGVDCKSRLSGCLNGQENCRSARAHRPLSCRARRWCCRSLPVALSGLSGRGAEILGRGARARQQSH